MSLPIAHEVSYNGVTLPTESRLVHCSVTPEKSKDGRTNIANRYRFAWNFFVAHTLQQDQGLELEDIRARLTRNAGIFTLVGLGFGDMHVNQTQQTGALDFGPWSKITKWIPHGTIAAEVGWEIEFLFSDCNDYPYERPQEFGWTVDFQLGPDRLERRVINGHLSIGGRRANPPSHELLHTVDFLFERVVPKLPLGYERQNESRNISEDKVRLDFSFTDVEILTPRPPGVIKFSFDHHQQVTKGFIRWSGTFTGQYEMARHVDPRLAMTYFTAAVNDRIDAIKKASSVFGKKGVAFVGTGFSARESAADRTADFTYSWTTASSFPTLMSNTMWRALPGHDHARWAASMKAIYIPRGPAGTRIRRDDDLIVDLCDGPVGRLNMTAKTVRPGHPGTIQVILDVECPPVHLSYLQYDMQVSVEVDSGVTKHQSLPQKKPGTPKPTGGASLGQEWAQESFGGSNGLDVKALMSKSGVAAAKGAKAAFQQSRVPQVYVTLIGQIVRVCYEPAAPQLQRVGGLAAIPMNRVGHEYFSFGMIGNYGVPIYGAVFRQRFALADLPASFGPPNTPTAPTNDATLAVQVDGAAAGSAGSAGTGAGASY